MTGITIVRRQLVVLPIDMIFVDYIGASLHSDIFSRYTGGASAASGPRNCAVRPLAPPSGFKGGGRGRAPRNCGTLNLLELYSRYLWVRGFVDIFGSGQIRRHSFSLLLSLRRICRRRVDIRLSQDTRRRANDVKGRSWAMKVFSRR